MVRVDTLRALAVATNSLRYNPEIDPDVAVAYERLLVSLRDKLCMEISSQPLTLSELQKINDEPVWIQAVGKPGVGYYTILHGYNPELNVQTMAVGTIGSMIDCNTYGKTWLAYHQRPANENIDISPVREGEN